MTARPGMANLIAELRENCNAGTADYTVGATTYWTDDQIQTEFDRTQNRVRGALLDVRPQITAGSVQFFDYIIPVEVGQFIEENGDATDGWIVNTGNWQAVDASTYSVNYQARIITFNANTHGSAFFLDCRSYDMFGVAATIWRRKAAAAAGQVDWKSDNHMVNASQEYDHCMAMAERFDRRAGIQTGTFVRNDEAPQQW